MWRSHPLPQCSAGYLSSPTLLSSQGTGGCHHREDRWHRAPGVEPYLPGSDKEVFLLLSLCLGKGFCHPPVCWVSATCPRWATGTRAVALATRRAPGDSSPLSCSGRYRGTASACALWIGLALCHLSDARRTGGLQDIPISSHQCHPPPPEVWGTHLRVFFGIAVRRGHPPLLTRVGVEAPGRELERGVVAAPAGLVGIVTAALHGELIQPGAVGALVPNGGKRSPHRACVRHHLRATPASRGGG